MRGRLGSPKNLALHAGNFGTRFGQSWTDLGLKMDPRCFTCVLNCGFGCCEAGNGHGFSVPQSGTDAW